MATTSPVMCDCGTEPPCPLDCDGQSGSEPLDLASMTCRTMWRGNYPLTTGYSISVRCGLISETRSSPSGDLRWTSCYDPVTLEKVGYERHGRDLELLAYVDICHGQVPRGECPVESRCENTCPGRLETTEGGVGYWRSTPNPCELADLVGDGGSLSDAGSALDASDVGDAALTDAAPAVDDAAAKLADAAGQ